MRTREKYCYGVGALGKDLAYALVATYLMIYLSDGLGMDTTFIGILFFVARLWDAINDPMMGLIVDNTKTKYGKFRPWILIGTLVNAVIMVLLFNHPGLSGTPLYVYISVTYILWGMTYTIMDIPYWSFIPALSRDKRERNTLSVIPRVFASIGSFLVASCGIVFVKDVVGDYQRGFGSLAIMIAVAFIVCTLITVCHVKEKATDTGEQTYFKFEQLFQTLYRNDQLMVLVVVSVLYYIAMFLTTGFGIYYFKYDIGDETLFSTFTIVAGVSQVLAMAIFPKIAQYVKRRTLFIAGGVCPLIGFVAMFIIGLCFNNNLIMIMVAGVVLFLGFGFGQVLATVMLADTVDYGEKKLGYRSESIVFSMQPLMVKFATAVQGLITGIGLSLIGYQENQQQSIQTLQGMRVIMFAVPAVLIGASLSVYLRAYRLEEADEDETTLVENIEMT